MQGSTHLTVGIAAGLAVAPARDWQTLALSAALGGVAALVPDWFQVNIPGLSKRIRGIAGHRALSHWIWTAGLVALALTPIFGSGAFFSIFIGYLSHIALDAVSGGCWALWPLRLRLATIKTGSWMDTVFGASGLVLAGVQIVEVALA